MSWFVYVVRLAPGVDRPSVVDALAGTACRRGCTPPHSISSRTSADARDAWQLFSVTEDIAERTLALPFHNNLVASQVDYIVDALRRAVTKRDGGSRRASGMRQGYARSREREYGEHLLSGPTLTRSVTGRHAAWRRNIGLRKLHEPYRNREELRAALHAHFRPQEAPRSTKSSLPGPGGPNS